MGYFVYVRLIIFGESRVPLGTDRQRGVKAEQPTGAPTSTRFLVLCQCLQQDLRHLQRTLRTSDLTGAWDELDDAVISDFRRMRGEARGRWKNTCRTGPDDVSPSRSSQAPRSPLPFHLPCYAAAAELLDVVIDSIFELTSTDGTRLRFQRRRYKDMFDAEREQVNKRLYDVQRKVMVESSSVMWRKWLSVIPYVSHFACPTLRSPRSYTVGLLSSRINTRADCAATWRSSAMVRSVTIDATGTRSPATIKL